MKLYANPFPLICAAFFCFGTGVGIEIALQSAPSAALPYVAMGLTVLSSVLFIIPHFLLLSKPDQVPQP